MEIQNLKKKKQRAQKENNQRQLERISKDLGDRYFELGRNEEALEEYLDQLEACEALNDKLNLAVAHRMIGETHTNLGNFETALSHLAHYVHEAEESKSLVEQQRAYATLGRTQFCRAESLDESKEATEKSKALSAAKKAYRKSLQICQELNTNSKNESLNPREVVTMQARLLLNLGLVLEAQKEPKEAIELIDKAIELCTKNQLLEDLHRTYLALGTLQERQENYEKALEFYEKSATIYDDPLCMVNARISEAELLLKCGRWFRARKILVDLHINHNKLSSTAPTVEKLLKIAAFIDKHERELESEEDNAQRLTLYENMGDVAVAGSCYEKAIDYYKGMLACAEKDPSAFREKIAAALVSLAQTLKDAKRFREALTFARRELQLCANDDRETARSAVFLADLLSCIPDSSPSEIHGFYQQALASATRSGDLSLQRTVLREMHAYYLEIDDSVKIERVKNQLEEIEKKIPAEDSSSVASNDDVDIDIDLDELSDVETERPKKCERKSTRRASRLGDVKRNNKGETDLHLACIKNDIKTVEQLLEAGHPVNVRDNVGWTPLHEVANYGFVEIAKLLIKAGANVNDPGGFGCGNLTPLHDAATCGHSGMINLLIENGANVRLKTDAGESIVQCFEGYRNRIEDSCRKGEVVWTTDDEEDYQFMLNKLRLLVPPEVMASDKNSDSSGDEDDGDCGDEAPPGKRLSAGEDYRQTIEAMRNRGRMQFSQKKARRNKALTPLVNCDLQLNDDWLEDDVESFANCSRRSDEGSSSKRKNFRSTATTPELERESKRLRRSGSDVPSQSRRVSSPRRSSDVPRECQPSLLQMGGFSREIEKFQAPSPEFLDSSSNISTVYSEPVQFRISVEDRIISVKLILVDSENLLRNLNNSVVEKFRQDTGCTPAITFFTVGNAPVLPEDIFRLIDGSTCQQLIGQIDNVDVPKITERFQTICAALNDDNDDEEVLINSLRAAEQTESFRFDGGCRVRNIMPLLKSLEFEKTLKVLDLSNTALYSHGQLVNRVLVHLVQLHELRLQICDIDQTCLLQIHQLPRLLRVLDLSYNPLDAGSEEKLAQLLAPLRHIQYLNLSSCQLRKVSSVELNASVEHLDISWNEIEDSVIHLLQRQLINLNLSYSCRQSIGIFESRPIAFMTLDHLDLAGCNINDSDIFNLLRNCENLIRIVVADNPNVSQAAIEALLTRKPTLTLIDAMGCAKISKQPQSTVVIDNPSICTLSVSLMSEVVESWRNLWQGYVTQVEILYGTAIFQPHR